MSKEKTKHFNKGTTGSTPVKHQWGQQFYVVPSIFLSSYDKGTTGYDKRGKMQKNI